MHKKGNHTVVYKKNDLNSQALIDFYVGSNVEKGKLRLNTLENNLCKLKIKKIICVGYKMCFDLLFSLCVFA